MKSKIVLILAAGLIIILLCIVGMESYLALVENTPISESTHGLLQSALTGTIGIIAGFVSGKAEK
jgi:hypothetical protein|tara:strand:- start:316 stop:510 length:195 start_codon:yes stop_codon:yes gene_type:complete